MKICVTGGTGLVGNAIKIFSDMIDYHTFYYVSKSNADNNYGKGLDLTVLKDVDDYFKRNQFDYIIHLAANVGGLYKNMNGNIEMFNDNILINMNVLTVCNKYNINRGIFCLSSCIYPNNPSRFPMDETMIHESPPHISNEGYAYAKRMLEKQCSHYNKAFNREYICLIPVNLYGKHDYFNLKNGHFIPMIMHRFHRELLLGNELIAYGTGKPLRQFLYVEDFARIILDVLLGDHYNVTTPLICCNDQEYTIKNIVDMIAFYIGIDNDAIHWDTTKSDGCMKKTVTNAKFKSFYPDFQFTPIDKGLEKTYSWFKENYPHIRK
jgi:GDP-L-fucose synthase|uniref:NAD-dependent epimerase/dehydratase domain-containing protein n=1 Tax=viral metagenome TaxID=1070528 RepID=A0A6C0ALA0_9ZZZZ